MNRLAGAFAWLVLLFSLHVALSWFWAPVRAGLLGAALLVIVVCVCGGTGRLLLKAFRLRGLSESEGTLIGCTLGLGALALAMFSLAALGLLRTWAVAALLAFLWVVGFTELRDAASSLAANRNLLRDRPVWAAAVLAPVALVFWTAWMPPHHYDAMVSHLALPQVYLRRGGLVPVGHLVESHFPQNAEMLFSLALALGPDLLAQLLSWLSLALGVWWVFEMGKREMPLQAALLACGLTATHTAVALLGGVATPDSLAMLWVTAAVMSFCRWREISTADPESRGWLLLSAVFSGLAAGTKYSAALCPAILVGALAGRWLLAPGEREAGRGAGAGGSGEPEGARDVESLWGPARIPAGLGSEGGGPTGLPAAGSGEGLSGAAEGLRSPGGPAAAAGPRSERASRLADLAFFASLSAGAASPWLVKNLFMTGNPVFPWLAGSFPAWGVGPSAAPEAAGRYFALLADPALPARGLLSELVSFPYLSSGAGRRFAAGADVLGDVGWGMTLALVPAALWAARWNRTLRWVAGYAAAHWACWLAGGLAPRLLVPLVPLVCLAGAAGVIRAWDSLGRAGRAALGAGLGLLVAANVGIFLYVHGLYSTWDVLLGLESREAYLSRRLDYYPCASWAAEHVSPDARLLVVGDQRGYYVRHRHGTTSAAAANPFVDMANRARDPAELAGFLKGEGGLTHVLFAPEEARRLAQHGAFPFTEAGRRNWAGLWAGDPAPPGTRARGALLKRLYDAGFCSLYEII